MDVMQEFRVMLGEALSDTEQALALEDKGWIGGGSAEVIPSTTRVSNLRKSRVYALQDPLCRQAIRLWTDYSFGTGMTWASEDEKIAEILGNFWDAKRNQPVLSARGQRMNSDRLLIDGEIFMAVFPSPDGFSTVRYVDPLEITEIVTNPDDYEDVRFFKREWTNPQHKQQAAYYRSLFNPDNEDCQDQYGSAIRSDQDATIFHLAINTIGQRGNPLLLPILDWIKLYRQFMASRVAIMLAVAKFAWKIKVVGGASVVTAAKTAVDGQTIEPASVWAENQGADLQQIKTDTNSAGAYNDARMLRLQFCSGVGWPEQYFGDLSCYAADTEVLSERGWIRHEQWRQGEKVASYNPETRSLEWLEPLRLNSNEYHGQMVHFDHGQADILVTPNHRMWAAKHSQAVLKPPRENPHRGGRRSISEGGPAVLDRTWQFYEARQILAEPRTHGWQFQNSIQPISGNGYKPPLGHDNAQAWAKLVGYWLSEGHCLSDVKRSGEPRERVFYRTGISQNPSVVLDNMRDSLAQLGYRFHEQVNQGGTVTLMVVNQDLWRYMRSECGTNSHDKRIPNGLLDANPSMRAALFQALMEGDGGYANGQHSGGLKFSTISKALADGMMTLALGLGYVPSLSEESRQYRGEPHRIWRVTVRDRLVNPLMLPHDVHSEDYHGMVYCLALPKNHIYVTRRNGKVAIQGNTGNLATAKTVELPVAKMCQSYQAVWSDFYDTIDNYVLDVAGIPDDDRQIDRDFPSIAPEDQAAMAASIQQIVAALPKLADSRDVLQQALMSVGVLNTNEAIEALEKELAKAEAEKEKRKAEMPPEMQDQMDKPFPQDRQSGGNGDEDPATALAKILKGFRESITKGEHDDHPSA